MRLKVAGWGSGPSLLLPANRYDRGVQKYWPISNGSSRHSLVPLVRHESLNSRSSSMWPTTRGLFLPSIFAAVSVSAALLTVRSLSRRKHLIGDQRCMGVDAEGGEKGHVDESNKMYFTGKDELRTSRFENSLSDHDKEILDSKIGSFPGHESAFDVATFFSALKSESIGSVVLYSAILSSTQTVLFRELESEEDGVICLADRQVAGRGRGNNVWKSPDGCLTFSFSTSVQQAAILPFFQYLVSMAVYTTVSKMTGGPAKDTIGLQVT